MWRRHAQHGLRCAVLCCADTPRTASAHTLCCLCTVLPLCVLQRTFREIMFLQDLNNHDNIIR
jgi:hypothetical protein